VNFPLAIPVCIGDNWLIERRHRPAAPEVETARAEELQTARYQASVKRGETRKRLPGTDTPAQGASPKSDTTGRAGYPALTYSRRRETQGPGVGEAADGTMKSAVVRRPASFGSVDRSADCDATWHCRAAL